MSDDDVTREAQALAQQTHRLYAAALYLTFGWLFLVGAYFLGIIYLTTDYDRLYTTLTGCNWASC